MLHKTIPIALHYDTNPTSSVLGPHVDGVIGSIGNTTVNQVVRKMGKLSIKSSSSKTMHYTQPSLVPFHTFDVHMV